MKITQIYNGFKDENWLWIKHINVKKFGEIRII